MSNSESLLLPESIGKRVDPSYSKTLQTRLKELLHSQNDSFPGSQPVSFESKHLLDIEREDYFVCEKSDGVRYLLFFLHSTKGPASFLYDRNKYWYYVPNLLFPVRGRENEYLKDTLMDGELVLDIDEHKKTWRYLIFDLMVVNGSTIIQRSFSTRLGMLQQDVIHPFNIRMRNQNDPTLLPPFTIELKRMERSYGLHVVFEQIPKLKHKSDGIIWTPVKCPYTSGTCEKLLKWKPPELNTVDFRIAARWSKEHKPIYSIEVLSNGVTYKFYDHFQPDPALATTWKNQLPDGRIAEFRYDSECQVTIVEQGYAPTLRKGGWRFVRFRDDKNIANDEQVVKKILNSTQDGVTKEQLLLCMDRVRAAWKAREKGLPMPPLPLKDAGDLSLSTQLSPTSSLNTPTSASTMIHSPSSLIASTGYFRDYVNNNEYISRNNSISDEPPIITAKRKSSVSSVTTPLKEEIEVDDVERKRLKAVEEEEESPSIPVNNIKKEPSHEELSKSTTLTSSITHSATTVTPPIINTATKTNVTAAPVFTASPPVRRRKISSVSESNVKKVNLDESDPPPSIEKSVKMRKTTPILANKRTTPAPMIIPLKKQKEPSPSLPPPLLSSADNSNRNNIANNNRRSRSIPQLPKETTISKKLKPSSSSSIHNLLTTSVEPTATNNSSRAYNFPTILQRNEHDEQPSHIPHQHQVQQQVQKKQQHLQVQQQQLQAQQHHAQQAQLLHQPQTPVQFINFHAEGQQSIPQANNHVLIIRSESNSQSQPQQKSSSSRVWKTNNNVKYEGQNQHPSQQPYSLYNNSSNNSNAPSYQHLPPQPYQRHQEQYYGIPMYSQQPPPQQSTSSSSSSPYGYRRNEQQVAQEYQLQQQQQQQPQSQHKEIPKRKNSQKAKLDFILN